MCFQYKQVFHNTLTKVIADIELKKKQMEEREHNERKRQREMEEEIEAKAKREKEWKKEWEVCHFNLQGFVTDTVLLLIIRTQGAIELTAGGISSRKALKRRRRKQLELVDLSRLS